MKPRNFVEVVILVALLAAFWTWQRNPESVPENPSPCTVFPSPRTPFEYSVPGSLWLYQTNQSRTYLDLQGQGKLHSPRGDGTWSTASGQLRFTVGSSSEVIDTKAQLLCADYPTCPLPQPKPEQGLKGTCLWLFRSPAWNGYLEMRRDGRYWTHWGWGHWTLEGEAFTLRNDYDPFSHHLTRLADGHLRGARSDGVAEEMVLLAANLE